MNDTLKTYVTTVKKSLSLDINVFTHVSSCYLLDEENSMTLILIHFQLSSPALKTSLSPNFVLNFTNSN